MQEILQENRRMSELLKIVKLTTQYIMDSSSHFPQILMWRGMLKGAQFAYWISLLTGHTFSQDVNIFSTQIVGQTTSMEAGLSVQYVDDLSESEFIEHIQIVNKFWINLIHM